MELFKEDTICLDLKAQNKAEVIGKMVNMLDKAGVLNDKKAYELAVWAREEKTTTGIGFGIAIPHAKTNAVKEPRVAIAIVKDGVDYQSEDGSLAYLIFMIAACDGEDDLHLRVLARLSRKLIDPVFRSKLLHASDKQEIMIYLKQT
ncbi:hypothetical protein P22_2799 [Propionispora sp. 2/2-37]|uniref:PTS sugar transporter subunit IIA n=1 Tax=Propionispora sp. 2/2-37 TaxID=1677858 RepID=UPI0006BB9565|nr:fructose PTS transporter subunit IIA [Propionispora sp. 2/2-37]CUH96709.1 hypothetical protein P22_2799 [Propionispora sp. 2/2-37]